MAETALIVVVAATFVWGAVSARLERAGADDAVAVIAVTVLLSLLAHGVSAAPLAARYGRFAAARGPETGRRSSRPGRPWPAASPERTPARPERVLRRPAPLMG